MRTSAGLPYALKAELLEVCGSGPTYNSERQYLLALC